MAGVIFCIVNRDETAVDSSANNVDLLVLAAYQLENSVSPLLLLAHLTLPFLAQVQGVRPGPLLN